MRHPWELVFLLSACNAVFDLEATAPAPPISLSLSPRTLVFDNSASTTDLVEFPVLVTLDSSRIGYADVTNPATDLRFEADGVDLPFEIERWDPTDKSEVWVRVPLITAGSTTDRILMHYGPYAHGTERPAEVWSSYELVVHASDDYASSVGGFIPTATGVTQVPGQIGGAARFNGPAADNIVYGGSETLLDGWPQYTFEFWLYADYATAILGVEPRFLEKGASITLGRLLQTGSEFAFKVQIDTHYTTASHFRQTVLPLRRWIQIVYTYDGERQLIYRNGIISDLANILAPSTLVSSAGSFRLGGNGGVSSLTGMLDEIRISRASRSPDWIDAQHKSMTGSFVSVRVPGPDNN